MASIVKLLTWLSVGFSSLPVLFCFAGGSAFVSLLARKESILSATFRFLSKRHFVKAWLGSFSFPAACATLCLDKPKTRAVTRAICQKEGSEHVLLQLFCCSDNIVCPLMLLKSVLSRKHNFPDVRILRFLSRKFFSTLNKLDEHSALLKRLKREMI